MVKGKFNLNSKLKILYKYAEITKQIGESQKEIEKKISETFCKNNFGITIRMGNLNWLNRGNVIVTKCQTTSPCVPTHTITKIDILVNYDAIIMTQDGLFSF